MSEWNELSMRDRAAYIRKAVSKGLKNIDDIRLDYAALNIYDDGGNTNKPKPKEEYVYEVLPRLLKEAGLNVRVTSGYRKAGVAGTAGNKSWHTKHGAADIVPQGNTTFEDIEYALYNNPAITSYMLQNNLGLLDESGRSNESRNTMKRTGATGAHFHIGRDSKPSYEYANKMAKILSNTPITSIPTTTSYTSQQPITIDEILANINKPVITENNDIVIPTLLSLEVATLDEPEENVLDNTFNMLDAVNNILSTASTYTPAYITPNTLDNIAPALDLSSNPDLYLANLYDKYYKYEDGGNLYPIGGLLPINVPAALKGAAKAVKNRLYRTITPEGYHLGRAAKEFIKGDTRSFDKFTPAENEVWARYLGVPYNGESNFEPAIYRPTKGGTTYNDVIKFKDESLVLSDEALQLMLQHLQLTGKNTMLIEGNLSGLGTYTMSLGLDDNGKYISYYDDWDINPTRGLSAKYKIPFLEKVGDIVPGSNPFTVYGRRYYTDDDIKRINSKSNGGPIVEAANRFDDGGVANIFRRPDGTYFYQESPNNELVSVRPINTILPDPSLWIYVDDEGKHYNPKVSPVIYQGIVY